MCQPSLPPVDCHNNHKTDNWWPYLLLTDSKYNPFSTFTSCALHSNIHYFYTHFFKKFSKVLYLEKKKYESMSWSCRNEDKVGVIFFLLIIESCATKTIELDFIASGYFSYPAFISIAIIFNAFLRCLLSQGRHQKFRENFYINSRPTNPIFGGQVVTGNTQFFFVWPNNRHLLWDFKTTLFFLSKRQVFAVHTLFFPANIPQQRSREVKYNEMPNSEYL